MIAVVPPELVLGGITLLLLGGFTFALVRQAGSKGKATTERDALAKAEKKQDEALKARDDAERKGRSKWLE